MQHTRILAKRGAAARRELEDESSRPAHGRAGGSCRRHYRCHILGSCLSLIGVLQTSPFSVFMNYIMKLKRIRLALDARSYR